jgi:hypothetical protein
MVNKNRVYFIYVLSLPIIHQSFTYIYVYVLYTDATQTSLLTSSLLYCCRTCMYTLDIKSGNFASIFYRE